MRIEEETETKTGVPVLPPQFVPTPTREYREHRKTMRLTLGPGAPAAPVPVPVPIPVLRGPRVLIWKQDPTVAEIGIRKAYLPGPVLAGPRDARFVTQGVTPVSPNVTGDLIVSAGSEAFDAVHTFAVVRQTLTMYQRALNGAPLPWQWNSPNNTEPLNVFPRAGITMNAFYSRTQKALKFFFFDKPGTPGIKVFTCRSFDIVAHETGHAILDGLKPGWISIGNPPQSGALHESFGDLTAIFLALSQLDQVEAIIAQTKANLHDKSFIADVAEEFGLALGRPNGLRNADNDLRLSQVSNEVHDLSQVFTGGIYDILADIFQFEQRPLRRDDSSVLYEAAQYVCSLVLRAILAAPNTRTTFADVVNQMLNISFADGKPVQYRNFIRNRFTVREVVVSTTPLNVDLAEGVFLVAAPHTPSEAPQSRRGCCGTMQLPEYMGAEQAIETETRELQKAVSEAGEARVLAKTAGREGGEADNLKAARARK